MLIFDGFPDKKHATLFAAAVKSKFGLRSWIFSSQKRSDEVDPFPAKLNPPIVLVERSSQDFIVIGTELEFSGTFAGT